MRQLRNDPESGRRMAELLHDLAPELELLRAYAERAIEEGRSGHIALRELDAIRTGSESLAAMLHDALDQLHGRAPAREDGFSPREVTHRLITALAPSLRAVEIDFICRLPREQRIAGRSSWYRRALHNLLRNAAAHARSQILVTLEAVDEAQVRVSVEDDGAGWSAPSHPEGYGLGLTSVRWAAEVLGGEVAVHTSRDLGGAHASLTVPLARSRGADPETRLLGGLRVAIIDDSPVIADVLTRLLTRMGAQVETVPVPLDPAWPASGVPDAVLLDVHLGVDSGVRLYEQWLSRVPGLAGRVIFLTGDPFAEGLCGRPVLLKPVDSVKLAETVAEIARSAAR